MMRDIGIGSGLSKVLLEKKLLVSVVIITRNRVGDLRRALDSCCAQESIPLEVVVYDDCSTDATQEAIQREYPWVRYVRADERVGYIPLRNRGYDETNAEFIVSIDDDAYFTATDTLAQLVSQMQDMPKLAAMAIPYLEPIPRGRTVQSCTLHAATSIRSFVGTAHICRVDAVRAVGKYREFFIHQGEERDLCLRLRQEGWNIRTADSQPLVHCVSPYRDLDRMHRWGTRNMILFEFFHVPLTILPAVWIRRCWQMLRYRFSPLRAAWTLKWIGLGFRHCIKFRTFRQGLGLAEYRAYLSLPSHGPVYVDEAKLPPPCGSSAPMVKASHCPS